MNRNTVLLWMLLALAGCGADTRESATRIAPDSIGPASSGPASSAGDTNAASATAPPSAANAATDTRGIILFLGTSLTAGFGLGEEFAYPARIQEKIDSAALPFRVVNAGLAGETSAGGLRRLEWSLQQPIEVLVLELGANDGLRGLPVESMRANLDTLLARTRARYPDAGIVITGMEAPPNLGARYTNAFRATYRDLAEKYDAALVPFLLEGVGGRAQLNQEDGIHPNAEGQRILAGNVWPALLRVLEQRLR
jgi:acyl-CoA thioesterase-1